MIDCWLCTCIAWTLTTILHLCILLCYASVGGATRHTVVSVVILSVSLSVIMPRAELLRHTVIVLSVRPSVCLSVFYKHFSSLAKNKALKQATQADIDICSDLY